jgi:hypothetical protein
MSMGTVSCPGILCGREYAARAHSMVYCGRGPESDSYYDASFPIFSSFFLPLANYNAVTITLVFRTTSKLSRQLTPRSPNTLISLAANYLMEMFHTMLKLVQIRRLIRRNSILSLDWVNNFCRSSL